MYKSKSKRVSQRRNSEARSKDQVIWGVEGKTAGGSNGILSLTDVAKYLLRGILSSRVYFKGDRA